MGNFLQTFSRMVLQKMHIFGQNKTKDGEDFVSSGGSHRFFVSSDNYDYGLKVSIIAIDCFECALYFKIAYKS